jgi:elongation factor G
MIMGGRPVAAPRCAALIGPYLSGKTSLLESLLFITGAIGRKGSARDGSTVGDSVPEARARQMSTELNVASTSFLDETWTFLDCPGSIELGQEAQNTLMAVDAAVIVCEPEVSKALMLAPLFKFLDDRQIPHMLFINKMDTATHRISEVLSALQAVSARPLVLREVPIREGGGPVTGYVDLVSERAYRYHPGQPSDLVQIPEDLTTREQEARQGLLETLADFDDKLLEQLLEDAVPSKDEIYGQLSKDFADDLLVPVFFGVAERDHGVRRLLKALRHEVPGHETTALRLGLDPAAGDTTVTVFKTYHQAHTGKLSLARVWAGKVEDGNTLNGPHGGGRVGGLFRMRGHELAKQTQAGPGDVIALGRLDAVATGATLTASGKPAGTLDWPATLSPLFSLAIVPENRQDEVKLSASLHKLTDEDPSLSVEHNADTHEMLIWGQGEIHLQIALDRLKLKYNMPVKSHRPTIGYKETIRKATAQHARFKRQSGGHGQFGDVHVEVRPLARGTGFEFHDKVVGGAIPRQYIPSVEDGVRDYLSRGPLGFAVVDVAVTLTDGQYHSVDSSDMAFKTAGRMAMQEAMPKCEPVLLEPIFLVQVSVPNEFTARVHGLVSGRRGQILGFDAKQGWSGWDAVSVYLPQSELHDLIIELRSLTMGVGTFSWKFDHLQELSGRLADKVVESRAAAAAQ